MYLFRSKKDQDIKKVFVLGSTSETAKAICIELAKCGCKKFHLLSRCYEDNKDLIQKINEIGANQISYQKVDLSTKVIDNPPQIDDFDLYIVAIGYLGEYKTRGYDLREIQKIHQINFEGLVPWLNSITNSQRINRKGKLWVFSSVAGDRGKSSNFVYGASKAALTIFCEGLLMKCHKAPFKIRVIKAGYINTKTSKGIAPQILCISPEKLAAILLKKPGRQGIEYLPWWWGLIMFIFKLLPISLIYKL